MSTLYRSQHQLSLHPFKLMAIWIDADILFFFLLYLFMKTNLKEGLKRSKRKACNKKRMCMWTLNFVFKSSFLPPLPCSPPSLSWYGKEKKISKMTLTHLWSFLISAQSGLFPFLSLPTIFLSLFEHPTQICFPAFGSIYSSIPWWSTHWN